MNRVDRLKKRRKKKWIGIGIAASIASAIIIIWYYIAIQFPMWEEREDAKQTILSESELKAIERFNKFVTEDVYHVATGYNENEEELYVALSENGSIATFEAADGLSRDEIIAMHEKSHPEADILRVMPGIWRGFWVWEVFYELKEEQGTRKRYDYYDLTSGELLETYRLRLQP